MLERGKSGVFAVAHYCVLSDFVAVKVEYVQPG
jgi:hypothetical protein